MYENCLVPCLPRSKHIMIGAGEKKCVNKICFLKNVLSGGVTCISLIKWRISGSCYSRMICKVDTQNKSRYHRTKLSSLKWFQNPPQTFNMFLSGSFGQQQSKQYISLSIAISFIPDCPLLSIWLVIRWLIDYEEITFPPDLWKWYNT